LLSIQVFRDITLCRCASGFRRFEAWQYLHIQISTVKEVTQLCFRLLDPVYEKNAII